MLVMDWFLLVLVALGLPMTLAGPGESLFESSEPNKSHYSTSKSENYQTSLEDDHDATSFAFVIINEANPDDAVSIHGSNVDSRKLECRLRSDPQVWASLYSDESGKLVAAMAGGASLYVKGMRKGQYFPLDASSYDSQILHPNIPYHEILFGKDETLLVVAIIPHDPTVMIPLKIIHNVLNLVKRPLSTGALLHLMQSERRGRISVVIGYMESSPAPSTSEDTTDLFLDPKIS